MRTAKKQKNRQTIRKLLEELKDVLDAFGWYGIGGEEVSAEDAGKKLANGEALPEIEQTDISEGDDEEDEESDETTSASWFYDPWDIQSAVDSAMSNLVKSNLLPELADAKNAPSFSEVCALLFGKEHEVTKQAEYFEDLIKGYEDQISKDDLREAYTTLASLMEKLGWKRGPE